MGNTVLELKNVNKVFSQGRIKKTYKLALDGINLKIGKGDRLVIIGESGMGKTTLARILSNLETPTNGEILWYDKPIKSLSRSQYKDLRVKIQYVHQDPYASLHPSKSIFKIISDPLQKAQGLKGDELYKKTKSLLETVGLTPAEYFFNKYPHHLSGGGRQRLAIARALTVNPEIIIADEPISMIDMSLRASIIKLLKDLNDKLNITIILILHDIGAARYFTAEKGNIAVLYGGKIVEFCSSNDIISKPLHPYTKVLINSSPIPDPEISRNREIPKLKSYDAPKRTPDDKKCPFIHACLYSDNRCNISPELIEKSKGHFVACHRVDEI
ncbi:ABC transporter ATP-binding protein [Caldicellulosiruptoraceae bacterium PP1]